MKHLRNEIIFGSTHRLELLNAMGFIVWGIILSIGINYPKGTGVSLMYESLQSLMRMQLWGTLFICLGIFQLLGLLCAMRWVRIHACGVSATIVCMLVYMFARLDVRYPFVTFGGTWAVALWLAMIHAIAAEKITSIFKFTRKPKPSTIELQRTPPSGGSGVTRTYNGIPYPPDPSNFPNCGTERKY